MESRVITVFSSRGGTIKVTTDASTWGDLKPLLREQGQETDGLLGTINTTKKDLEKNEDELPAGPFVIFFRPIETKAGSSRKEICAEIKEFITADASAKDFFNKDKNYTNKSTDDLEKLVASFKKGKGNSSKPEIAKVEEVVSESSPEVVKVDEVEAQQIKGEIDEVVEEERISETPEQIEELQKVDSDEISAEDQVVQHLEDALKLLRNSPKKVECDCEAKIAQALEDYKATFEDEVAKKLRQEAIEETARLRKEAVGMGIKL